jgi:hypothetical protein
MSTCFRGLVVKAVDVVAIKERLIELIEDLDDTDAARVLQYAESLHDWDAWDRQIEKDSDAGRLGFFEELAEQTRRERLAGLTKPL